MTCRRKVKSKMKLIVQTQLPHTETLHNGFYYKHVIASITGKRNASVLIMWCSGVGRSVGRSFGLCFFFGLNRHERIQHLLCLAWITHSSRRKYRTRSAHARTPRARKWKCVYKKNNNNNIKCNRARQNEKAGMKSKFVCVCVFVYKIKMKRS